MCTHVHYSTIYNSQDMKATKDSDSGVNKEDMIHTHT